MEINTFSVYSTISNNKDLNFVNYEKALALIEEFDDLTSVDEAKNKIKDFFGENLSLEYSLGNNNFCKIFDEIKYFKVKINIDDDIMMYYFEK